MANTQFDKNGFLYIPQAISKRYSLLLLEQVDKALFQYKDTDDILYENNSPKKLLYAFNKGKVFLKALVCLPIIKLLIANSDDPQFLIPTWEDVVIKQPYPENGFNIHQDLPMQSLIGNTFSIAHYLDDSSHNPVFFLPGSHHLGPLTRTQLNTLYKEKKDFFLPVPAIEFRTLNQLYQDNPWDKEWILKRRAIFVYTLEKYNRDRLSFLVPDYEELRPYLNNIKFKVPHAAASNAFDIESPYFHF